ncbi:MAG: hypothetical protein A2015_10200 [Spirochaetes bacterium GWF1_31_7]|nr:MAG: hypothetical protein A2Y30_05835 [Spirochaetes bacterium GWE1_32_154]OHD49701.1 MAG: hypothetical protein A2015_10200 [Spirochaetes bacterium GWF1_31_7]
MNSNKRIELLAPAGSPEALDAAIGEGADAIYLGLKDFNARARAKNFSYKQFEAIVEKVHDLDKKVFVTLNTVFEERETQIMYNILKYLAAVKPDGVIVQDLGTLALAHNYFPDLALHASTQMNISSSEGVNLLSKYNVKRVVLSRELDFEQIKEIRKNTGSELEIFAHGALCVSVSGACLFSSYFGGKSANRGRCTQACRRLYNSTSSPNDSKYLFSLNDLSLLNRIPEIEEIGINSLKLEGRMKSYQYIATVVKAFRLMIDTYPADRETAYEKAKAILENDFARKKTEYLFMDKNNPNITSHNRSGQTGIYAGSIVSHEKTDTGYIIRLDKLNDISTGDTIRIQSNDDKKRVSIKIRKIMDNNSVLIDLQEDFIPAKGNEVFIISKGDFYHNYTKIIPKSLDRYKKHPAITKLPTLEKISIKPVSKLPEGLYVKINKSADLHILQSEKPAKVIFHVTKSNIDEFFSNIAKTQFTVDDFIIYFEPYFDYNEQNTFKDYIEKLINKGFNAFIFNNLGQLNLLKKYDVEKIAGPFAYTFNSYAAQFFNDFHIKYIVTPIESNKRNLYSLNENAKSSDFLITIFSYPELFQIIPKLKGIEYEKQVIDSQNDYCFSVNSTKEKTSIIPEIPFSISDKVNNLKGKGFKKFIIDLAFTNINKNTYKQIIKAVKNSEHMEKTSRFNWKDGFYFDSEKHSTEDKEQK